MISNDDYRMFRKESILIEEINRMIDSSLKTVTFDAYNCKDPCLLVKSRKCALDDGTPRYSIYNSFMAIEPVFSTDSKHALYMYLDMMGRKVDFGCCTRDFFNGYGYVEVFREFRLASK